jgi:putative oxidoreductase
METNATKSPRVAQGRDRKQTAVRIAQIVLALIFLVTAFPKLVGVPAAVQMFDQIGAGQWLRYFVGTAELAGAIGLLLPRLPRVTSAVGVLLRQLPRLAAAGLAADMVGASIVNVVVLHSGAVVMTVVLCVACVLVARTGWAQAQSQTAALGRPR